MDRKLLNARILLILGWLVPIIVCGITMRWTYVTSEGDWLFTILFGISSLILFFYLIYVKITFSSKARRRRFIKEFKESAEEQENKRLEKKREKYWRKRGYGPSFMDMFRDDDDLWRY